MNLTDFKSALCEPPKMSDDMRMLALQTIVARNGIEKQHIIVMEELAELAQQVSKKLRQQENKMALLEELADVTICMEMLRYMNDIPKYELDDAIAVKLNNALRKIDREKEETYV